MPSLITTEVNRSGARLLVRMLNVHPNISMASDQSAKLFLSMRSAICPEVDAGSYPDNYYFSADGLANMKLIQQTNIGGLVYRTADFDSPSTAAAQEGRTYSQLLDSAVVNSGSETWKGFNTNGIIEFIPLIAQSLPDAKFIFMFRDPRAVIYSGLQREGDRESQDILRRISEWRKYIAFFIHLIDLDLLKDRVVLVSYERIIADPEACARSFCTLLGLPYEPKMIVAPEFIDPENGLHPDGNDEIYTHKLTHWEGNLLPRIIELVEYMCSLEMEALGYDHPTEVLSTEATNYFLSGAPTEQLDREILIYGYGQENSVDASILEPYFLFSEVHSKLRAGITNFNLVQV